MKRTIGLLVAAFFLSANTVLASANIAEPKDSFVLFGWRLYAEASAVVQLDSKPKPVAHVPAKTLSVSKPVFSSTPITVWYWAKASEYGGSDGFYYGHFACGGRYIPGTFGVANKTLPCGTRVQFNYHGRQIITRVLDRGPYCCGRSFDFTIAVAQYLHFPGIGTVRWRIVK